MYMLLGWCVCLYCICYMVGGLCVCVYFRSNSNVYIVNGLQPNGQCEFRLQGQCGFRLQCLVLPANWAVWIQTVAVWIQTAVFACQLNDAVWIQTAVFSPASQLGSVDLDCRGSVDSDCSVCLSAKWCSVDSHRLVIT